jgi:G3E family GTPase
MPMSGFGAAIRSAAWSLSSTQSTSPHAWIRSVLLSRIASANAICSQASAESSPEQLDQVEQDIRRLNKVASIHRTKNAEIDIATVLDLESADFAGKIDSLHAADDRDHAHGHDNHRHDHHHAHRGHHHQRHNHLQNIETACIVEPGVLDAMKLSVWFRSLIAEFGKDILRMKGILNLRGDTEQFLLQGVQSDFEGRHFNVASWRAAKARL